MSTDLISFTLEQHGIAAHVDAQGRVWGEIAFSERDNDGAVVFGRASELVPSITAGSIYAWLGY